MLENNCFLIIIMKTLDTVHDVPYVSPLFIHGLCLLTSKGVLRPHCMILFPYLPPGKYQWKLNTTHTLLTPISFSRVHLHYRDDLRLRFT